MPDNLYVALIHYPVVNKRGKNHRLGRYQHGSP